MQQSFYIDTSRSKISKTTLSKIVATENDDSKRTGRILSKALGDKFLEEFEKVHKTDTHEMLVKFSKELKLTDY